MKGHEENDFSKLKQRCNAANAGFYFFYQLLF